MLFKSVKFKWRWAFDPANTHYSAPSLILPTCHVHHAVLAKCADNYLREKFGN